MNSPKTNALIRHIRQIAAHPHGGNAPDAELLERFLSQHDEEAFNNLLRRHGPMVLAVCGSIVNDRHLAEDAFQATFLLLAKKAHWIYKRASIGSWLHGVARHVAMKARRSAVKHRVQEAKSERAASSDPLLDMNLRELQAVLHEELGRLPEKYRAPVVLCYLEGMTHEQAGRQLGWTPGTVRGRVNRGRELLRGRLTRRGLAVPAALLGLVLETPVRAMAMSAAFVSQTVNAAMATVAGQATAGLISAPVASLVTSGVRALALGKLKIATVSALAAALIGLTAWTAASSALSLNLNADKAAKAPLQTSIKRLDEQGGQVAKDIYGDPLPAGALARLGTVSLRHGEAIQAIALSPDGKTIASTDGGKFISVWDRSTGKEVRRIQDASGMAIAFSPDGKLLATAGGANVELFDAATGQRLHQLGSKTFTQKGNSTFSMDNVPLVFSADSRMVASANAEHIAMVWDTATGKELMRTVPMENPSSLRFLPDGKTLLSLSGARQVDGAIQLWEIATGKEISKLVIDHKKTMGSRPLAIAPDGKTVAIESLVPMREKRGNSTIVYMAHCIRLLDATTGLLRLHIQGKNTVIQNVGFSPDSRCLAWTNMDDEVTIWDTQADKLVHRFGQAGGGAGGSSAIAYDREGKTLATSSEGTALHLWDLVRGKELLNKEAHASSIRAIGYSRDGRMVASASADQTIRVWDAKTGKPLAKLTGHTAAADAIACSPEGRHLATAASDGSVRLWDMSTGREIHKFTLTNIDTGNGGARVVRRSVAYTPDGQTLMAAGSDLKFHRWDVGTGKELEQRTWSLDGVAEPGKETEQFVNPSHVRFSPDGRTAAATGGKAIHLVDVASGREFGKFAGEAGPETLAFSADGGTLVTGGWGKVLRVWEAASAKIIREIKVGDFINAVAVSPDGRIVAAGCGWNPAGIHLYDVVTGKEVLTFAGLTSYIGDLNFAPDGMALVSGHRDSTGLIWDVAGAYQQAKGAPKDLAGDELVRLWTELESEDAARANAAAWTLSSSPKSAAHFLKDRLPPAPKATVDRLQRLIADLDAEVFAKRQAASRELSSLGTDAHAELRKALQGKMSLEHRRRILALLDGPTRFMPDLSQLRRIRAIGVLERIGNEESVAILRNLALGAPAAPETQETKAALERLSRR